MMRIVTLQYKALIITTFLTTLSCKAEEDPFADIPSGAQETVPSVANEEYKDVVDPTMEERLEERFTLTRAESTALVGVIEATIADIKAAKSTSVGNQLPDTFITQATNLYNALPRDTTPVLGLTREIPASVIPFFNDGELFVRTYKKALPVAAVTNYMKLVSILNYLDKDQLMDFVISISAKSVPAKIDCVLYFDLSEIIKDNPFYEKASGVKDLEKWQKWNELHNPLYRELGMVIAPSVIVDKAKRIIFLEPYLAETDDLLLKKLIYSYASIGNQAAKSKLLKLANSLESRGKTELKDIALETADKIDL